MRPLFASQGRPAWLGWLLLCLGLAALPWLLGSFGLRFAAEVLLVGVAVLGLDLLVGLGGMASLGHGAVFGAAGYAAALLSAQVGGNLPLVLAAGVVAGALLSGLMGWAARRTGGLFFLVLTLIFGQMIWEVVFRWRAVTGGADGLRGFPRLSLGGWTLDTPLSLYVVVAVLALAALALARSFARAPLGQALTAWRDQPERMRALGFDARRIQIRVFLLAGALAGAAGSLYPFVNQYIGPNAVHWSMSATLMVMLVIGGVGTLHGGFVGAMIYLVIQTYISSYTERWQLIVGLIFVLTVIFLPHGVARLAQSVRSRRQA